MLFSRVPILLTAFTSLAISTTAQEEYTYQGAVTYTLAPVLGACGRVCNATYTCEPAIPYGYNCYGGDAAVPRAIFKAHYNASLGANSPICKSSVVVIDEATYNIGANVCTHFNAGGSTDLELAEGDFNAPGIVDTWLLLVPQS